MNQINHIYFCIDLKTFYASVECVERGLDPFTTNLVVADPSRGNGAICLAISPALKNLGIRNRCRIFEIPKDVNYLVAMPRMKLYMEYSAKIYNIYLKYIAPEDIHPYSIDEMFLDVTHYLDLYQKTKEEFAVFLMNKIFEELGITATCGIGTNLYLCKIALDITAKHIKSNIAYLDETTYRNTLGDHMPLSDFWQISTGIQNRLNGIGIYTMNDIINTDEEVLYKLLGINAEILIDHAKGIEPVTIKDIKSYKPKANSLSQSQILPEDYSYEKVRLIVKEMIDILSLRLVDEHLVSDCIGLSVGYSKDIHKATGGSLKLPIRTNTYNMLIPYFLGIFDKTTIKDLPIRRISIGFNNVLDEDYEQLDLFTNYEEIKKQRTIEQTVLEIKKKYGKNSILKGMNYLDGATTRKRNKLIGGHNAGEND